MKTQLDCIKRGMCPSLWNKLIPNKINVVIYHQKTKQKQKQTKKPQKTNKNKPTTTAKNKQQSKQMSECIQK